MHNQLAMTIQTIEVKDGAALKSVKPDKSGIYRGVPLAVLGKPSRGGCLYEPKPAMEAMTSQKSRFYLNVTEGNQEGEWGHPFADARDLNRMVYIDRARVSHYFKAIYFERLTDGNAYIVRGDIGPTGPYRDSLRDMFEDGNRNTSFSLRAITEKIPSNDGFDHRKIRFMVTFDAVDGPGFEMACKRYMPAMEGISVQDILALNRSALFSTESITDQEILDIFQADRVIVRNEDVGIFDRVTKTFVSPDGKGRGRSAVHEFMKGL